MIGVVDIGIGNIGSVSKVLKKMDSDFRLISNERDFSGISKLIFPGVGSYPTAVGRLQEAGIFDDVINHIDAGNLFLGICLGMQLLSKRGLEGVGADGLGIFDAEVVKMQPSDSCLLPHIGWNQINHDGKGLFNGIPLEADFYFVHSFYMKLKKPCKSFSVDYGGEYTCYVEKDNIFGAQFHPEKSQSVGLKFIENFLNA